MHYLNKVSASPIAAARLTFIYFPSELLLPFMKTFAFIVNPLARSLQQTKGLNFDLKSYHSFLTMAATDLQAYLNQAHISPEVFALRPDYRALLIAVSGIPIGPSDDLSASMLSQAEAAARQSMSEQAITDVPHIAAWREAYKAFGSKPNKFRNSVEALTRRITPAGKEPATGLPRVNRLTDIYNAISVKYQIPLGGEDLDKYVGAPSLVRAKGDEVFETTASGELVKENPEVGEVVWRDEAGVTCRRWNWRQGPRTALSEETTRVLFILDALTGCSDEKLETAGNELVEALQSLSGDVVVAKRLLKAS